MKTKLRLPETQYHLEMMLGACENYDKVRCTGDLISAYFFIPDGGSECFFDAVDLVESLGFNFTRSVFNQSEACFCWEE